MSTPKLTHLGMRLAPALCGAIGGHRRTDHLLVTCIRCRDVDYDQHAKWASAAARRHAARAPEIRFQYPSERGGRFWCVRRWPRSIASQRQPAHSE